MTDRMNMSIANYFNHFIQKSCFILMISSFILTSAHAEEELGYNSDCAKQAASISLATNEAVFKTVSVSETVEEALCHCEEKVAKPYFEKNTASQFRLMRSLKTR